ncbi:MAG: acyltransferase [Acidobacteria bacterium]|nr:acyltransferase [Acidobacteriota bacterium]
MNAVPNSEARGTLSAGLRLYISRQSGGPARYLLEQSVTGLAGWVPTIAGIALRALLYRLILKMDGLAAVEKGVRLRHTRNIRLGKGSYLDERVYLHACPKGIVIGPRTLVMYGSVLHVYNFRNIPHSGIWIGQDSLIGEYNVLRGQGGITIGNRVYTSPMVQLLAVNHLFDDADRPFVDQGITARGICIEDDVWIGAGAIVTDGVRIGKGAVVAAGAVVSRDIPPHTVVAGIPARVVREIGKDPRPSRDAQVYF